MSQLRNLEDLFEHELKDLYSAENQIIAALPNMIHEANDPQLKEAFASHLEETKNQKQRLERAFALLKITPGNKTCEAMAGLIAEGEDMIHEDATPETKDAGLIALAQKIEHYEISGYGTSVHFAKMLGFEDLQQLLTETLEEERSADSKLNQLAIESINEKAMIMK